MKKFKAKLPVIIGTYNDLSNWSGVISWSTKS